MKPRFRRLPSDTPMLDRLMYYVAGNVQTRCWEWQGAVASGYGIMSVRDSVSGKYRTHLPHRVAWELLRGPIPEGMQIDHLCRNRRCCNPEHLEPVSPRENTLRGETLPAANAVKTHCYKGHPFTPENTWLTAKGHRACQTCRRETWQRNGLKRKARRAAARRSAA